MVPVVQPPPVAEVVDTSTSIKFINSSEKSVQVFWVNGEEEVLYNTLEPGSEADQQTYVGH
jgi:hypothetical protein